VVKQQPQPSIVSPHRHHQQHVFLETQIFTTAFFLVVACLQFRSLMPPELCFFVGPMLLTCPIRLRFAECF